MNRQSVTFSPFTVEETIIVNHFFGFIWLQSLDFFAFTLFMYVIYWKLRIKQYSIINIIQMVRINIVCAYKHVYLLTHPLLHYLLIILVWNIPRLSINSPYTYLLLKRTFLTYFYDALKSDLSSGMVEIKSVHLCWKKTYSHLYYTTCTRVASW